MGHPLEARSLKPGARSPGSDFGLFAGVYWWVYTLGVGILDSRPALTGRDGAQVHSLFMRALHCEMLVPGWGLGNTARTSTSAAAVGLGCVRGGLFMQL